MVKWYDQWNHVRPEAGGPPAGSYPEEVVRWWSPRLWGAHLLALVCVGIAVAMGLWQYDAWSKHREAERIDLTESEPVAITEVLGPDDPFPTAGLGRPVEITGTFLDDATVLATGRDGAGEHAGEDGRWVVTPMTVGGIDEPAVPVVRGWVPADTTIEALPPAPAGEVEVLGWLQPPESVTGRPSDSDDTGADDAAAGDVTQTHVIEHVRIADLVQLVDQDLYGAYVIAQETLPSDTAAGLEAGTLDQLPPPGRFTALRNLLYAIEWWFFGAFAAFVWWRWVRDEQVASASVD